MEEPYRPPESRLVEPESGQPSPRSTLAAVLVGGLGVDFLGSLVVSIPIVLVWAGIVANRGGTAEDLEAEFQSVGFVLSLSAAGASMALAGGYVAARWARRRPVFHGVAAGTLSLAMSLPFLLFPSEQPGGFATGVLVLNYLLHVPLAAAGGHLAGRRAA